MKTDINAAIRDLLQQRLDLPVERALPDDQLLDGYEVELGIKFPQDYRLLLMEAGDSVCNGKDLLRVTTSRDNARELIMVAKEAWALGLPPNLLPFCEDNSDYFCLMENGQVCYWSHDGASIEKWPDLADWIRHVWLGGG